MSQNQDISGKKNLETDLHLLKQEDKMRKITSIVLTSVLVLIVAVSAQCGDFHRYGPSSGYKYHPRGDRHHGKQYRHNDRRILKEIRKNERRILKLERKVRKYERKRRYRGHYRYDYYTMRIRQLMRDIHRLEQRNRHLRQRLRR